MYVCMPMRTLTTTPAEAAAAVAFGLEHDNDDHEEENRRSLLSLLEEEEEDAIASSNDTPTTDNNNNSISIATIYNINTTIHKNNNNNENNCGVLGSGFLKHKRRYCRADGCHRIVKSQGLCQRHGAKPKICLVEGCTKQAQGNFDGMCKSHFKANKRATTPLPPKPDLMSRLAPRVPSGPSVYDAVIPDSLAWTASTGTVLPLIRHLREGFFDRSKPPAWHRNEERLARGMLPIYKAATQLEGWERELVWMEILLLTGNPQASFRHLARGWGRDKGFHMVLAQFICERQGDVLRKKRDYCYADDDDDPNSEDDDDEEEETDNNNNKVGEEESSTIDGGIISANVWDDACYGDKAYNEALAANLLDFSSTPRDSHHTSYCSNNSQENYDDMNDFQASEHQQHDLDSDQPAEDDNYVTETSNYGSGDTHHRKERDFSTELLEEYREKDNDLRNLTKDDDNPTLEEDNSVEGSGSNNHNHHHHNGREFSFELLEDYKEKESQLVNALQDDSLSEYAMFPN